MSPSIFCYNCGKQILQTESTCPICGAPQKAMGSSPPGVAANSDAMIAPPVAAHSPSAPVVAVPPGIKGWSWGAFLLNWIWAIGNRTWIGLLVFLPYVGIVMPIVLGIKGREWAWKNKSWTSVEHFNAVQRKWSIAGFIFTGVMIVLTILAFVGYTTYEDQQARQTEPTDITYAEAIADATRAANDRMPTTNEDLPFVGTRSFNFAGGSGTGENITIAGNGLTQIQGCGDPAMGGTCVLEYSGSYQPTMSNSDGWGWQIQGNLIYQLSNGRPVMTCGSDGQQQCVSELDAD